MTRKKKEELKEFMVTFNVTGRGNGIVRAKDRESAMTSVYECIEHEQLVEWEIDEVTGAEENV